MAISHQMRLSKRWPHSHVLIYPPSCISRVSRIETRLRIGILDLFATPYDAALPMGRPLVGVEHLPAMFQQISF